MWISGHHYAGLLCISNHSGLLSIATALKSTILFSPLFSGSAPLLRDLRWKGYGLSMSGLKIMQLPWAPPGSLYGTERRNDSVHNTSGP